MATLAQRLNNPGNLKAGATWRGLMPEAELNDDQRHNSKFACFEDTVWGFRALCILLLNYQRIDKLRTIAEIIPRYAPKSENNTESYIRDVCAHMGVGRNDVLDLSIHVVLASLAKAIATHESGGWFFQDGDLAEGVAQALDEYHTEAMA